MRMYSTSEVAIMPVSIISNISGIIRSMEARGTADHELNFPKTQTSSPEFAL
jgi:hypothetical protein